MMYEIEEKLVKDMKMWLVASIITLVDYLLSPYIKNLISSLEKCFIKLYMNNYS
jgi:hypothetical protein